MKNKIAYSFKACVSKGLMFDYIKNNLDEKTFFEVSSHLSGCKYCSEALKGLQQLPDFSQVNSLNKLFVEKTGIRIPSHPAAYFSKIILSVISFAVLIISVIIFQARNSSNPASDTNTNMNEQLIADDVNTTGAALNNEIIGIGKKNSFPNRKKLSATGLVTKENIHSEKPYKIPEKEAFIQNNTVGQNILSSHRSTTGGIVYLENLKTMDYSNLYSKSPLQLKEMLNHVLPQFENKEKQVKALEESAPSTDAFPYETALSNGLRNYNRGFYTEAIKDFDLILKYFPEDFNCRFYEALCFENTGRFADAEKLFSVILSNPDNVFFEEANWHLALSKISREELVEAKNILRQIAAENGFYKAAAEEKLNTLK